MCSSITHQPAALNPTNTSGWLAGRNHSYGLLPRSGTVSRCRWHHITCVSNTNKQQRAGRRAKNFSQFFSADFFFCSFTSPHLFFHKTPTPTSHVRVSQRVPVSVAVAGGQAGRRWSLLSRCPSHLRIVGIILVMEDVCRQTSGRPALSSRGGSAVRCGRAPNQASRERWQKKSLRRRRRGSAGLRQLHRQSLNEATLSQPSSRPAFAADVTSVEACLSVPFIPPLLLPTPVQCPPSLQCTHTPTVVQEAAAKLELELSFVQNPLSCPVRLGRVSGVASGQRPVGATERGQCLDKAFFFFFLPSRCFH
ncbi:uncharacterized protein BKA78DRAFT_170307 [Phyllosticta capitalensis]|uniref:uncharacterized protein n=1 Tax=Phyllosticta capitalensis TaxID=121624 RepID=UPI00312FC024